MKRLYPFLFFVFPFFGWSQVSSKQNIETSIHLLSYIARDYPNAVKDGKIINEPEYLEQQEFANKIQLLVKESGILDSETTALKTAIEKLILVVNQKKKAQKIADLSKYISESIIQITGIKIAPKNWPNLNKGEKLYQANCVSCHGVKGDGNGVLAINLMPRPANFLDKPLMLQVSAHQAYNTIKLGLEGTSMAAYSQFSDEELWDLAFYVKSMRFLSDRKDSLTLRKDFEKIQNKISLKKVSTLSDRVLLDSLQNIDGISPQRALTALRLLTPTKQQRLGSLSIAQKKLDGALLNYKQGAIKKARSLALNSYLEGIEPIEAQLKTIDADFVINLEQKMFAVRQIIEQKGSIEELKIAVDQANQAIIEAKNLLQNRDLDYWLTFIIAASIFLREGLEAFLVLAIILALIKQTRIKKALPWLHGGWISAVLLGIAGWFLSDYILQFGGKNREIMEGLVALFAVLVLVFVGFWLHENSKAKKWNTFINEKIGGYLKRDKMIGLATFLFMIVFREAFEVILFLQAINLEGTPENKSAIGFGVLAATAIIVFIAIVFNKYAKRIPIRQLFQYSSWIIVVLAVILMGKGIHALQESGWITMHSITNIQIEWLGIYPTLETLLGQIILLITILMNYFLRRK